MHILSLVTQKGGTGKSTLAVNLAVLAQSNGLQTCLIDLDPQGTVAHWYQTRAGDKPAVLDSQQVAKLPAALDRLRAGGFDLVVIDTPGVDSPATRDAMAAADHCLIPLRPSSADLNATTPTIAALRAMRREFSFVMNQAPANKQARLTQLVTKRLETDAPIAPVALAARMDHQYSYALGQGITEYAPHSKGAAEIAELWDWCCKQMESKQHKEVAAHGQKKRRA